MDRISCRTKEELDDIKYNTTAASSSISFPKYNVIVVNDIVVYTLALTERENDRYFIHQ
jgi:hypothetical protein